MKLHHVAISWTVSIPSTPQNKSAGLKLPYFLGKFLLTNFKTACFTEFSLFLDISLITQFFISETGSVQIYIDK